MGISPPAGHTVAQEIFTGSVHAIADEDTVDVTANFKNRPGELLSGDTIIAGINAVPDGLRVSDLHFPVERTLGDAEWDTSNIDLHRIGVHARRIDVTDLEFSVLGDGNSPHRRFQ